MAALGRESKVIVAGRSGAEARPGRAAFRTIRSARTQQVGSEASSEERRGTSEKARPREVPPPAVR